VNAATGWPKGLFEHAFRRHPAVPQMPDAQCIVPLREADTRSIPHQLAVKMVGNREREGAQEEQLTGGRLQPRTTSEMRMAASSTTTAS